MSFSFPLPEHALLLAALLFAMGLAGLLARRNIVFVLMSLEVMLNAAGLALVASGHKWAQADGQVLFIVLLAVAGCEAAVGLGLVMRIHRRSRTVDSDSLDSLKG